MLIREMTEGECRDMLNRLSFGRLACARDNQPYVVPISFAYDGKPALRVAAFPPPIGFNPFLWTGLVETERYYQTSDLDLLTGNYDPMAGARFYKEEPGPALEAALRSEVGADFARFARYMLSEVTDTPDGYAVQLSDLRFRRPGRAGFLCTIEMDRHYRVKGEDFGF